MVKEEHRIYVTGGKCFVQHASTTDTEIFLTIRSPLRARHARRGDHPKRTRTKHVPSHDEMGSRVGVRNRLKMGLEVDVVPRKRIHGVVHNRFRECRVHHQQGVHEPAGDGDGGSSGERLKGKITTDVVGGGVGDFDILEATGGDLEVVLRVTPRAETVVSGVGPDRGVIKVRGIYGCIRTGIQRSQPKALPCVQSQ